MELLLRVVPVIVGLLLVALTVSYAHLLWVKEHVAHDEIDWYAGERGMNGDAIRESSWFSLTAYFTLTVLYLVSIYHLLTR